MKKIFFLWLLTIFSTALVWLPFFKNGQMSRVFANYDGPNYIIIAKCWYDKTCIRKKFSLPLPLEYYPAHFPGYSFLISIFDQFLPGWWAMLLVNLISTGTMITTFYFLLKELKIKGPLFLSAILLFLPARVLVLRSVGAPETLFISALLLSILFFRKKNYLLSGISLAIAQVTKTPAILLFLAYTISILINDKFKIKKWLKKWPLLLGPLAILPVFLLFRQQTGDFLAYFYSGDNFHLVQLPFQSFIASRSWLGDFWLEDIIYIYLLGGLAIAYLYKKYRWDIITIFPGIFYLSTLFVTHRDISRYSAPLYPFWLIAFASFLKKKEFKIVFWLLLPAVYLYAINFINYNTAPVADWTPYF